MQKRMEAKIESLNAKACRLTSLSPAGVAVVEIVGEDAVPLLLRFWSPATQRPLVLNHIRYGRWCERDSSHEEDVVVCQTDIDRVEVHCHGGKAAAENILKHMVNAGAILVQAEERSDGWCEFAKDRISRNALNRLPEATTLAVARILLDQARGALADEVSRLMDELAKQEIDSAQARLHRLIQLADWGVHLIAPWHIAILGPPNVGKSSLLNRLLGYERAIVHDQPGTTRDALREASAIDGWPVRFIDTAGIRATDDPIEQAGIARSQHASAASELRLVLVSPDVGWTDEHPRLLQQTTQEGDSSRTLLVQTKSDLGLMDLSSYEGDSIRIECRSSHGHQPVLDWLASRLHPPGWKPGVAVPFMVEQVSALHACSNLLKRCAFDDAIQELRSLLD